MKTKGKPQMVRVARGRDHGQGDSTMERAYYHHALLLEHGSPYMLGWANLPHGASTEPEFFTKSEELYNAFQDSGHRYGLLIINYNAPTLTDGLACVPVSPLELQKLYRRHPRQTFRVISKMGIREEGIDGPRLYIGTTPGGDGFCTDERRITSA